MDEAQHYLTDSLCKEPIWRWHYILVWLSVNNGLIPGPFRGCLVSEFRLSKCICFAGFRLSSAYSPGRVPCSDLASAVFQLPVLTDSAVFQLPYAFTGLGVGCSSVSAALFCPTVAVVLAAVGECFTSCRFAMCVCLLYCIMVLCHCSLVIVVFVRVAGCAPFPVVFCFFVWTNDYSYLLVIKFAILPKKKHMGNDQ
ncbi:hypothetical protein SOVF_064480 [Spinacia oleracea]|nr:hypothetical protein SOVF_064480 [Spinacia oleracea]